jgi:phthalate 4,5-cis-dihydrodiol dehydrogenase
MLTLPSLLHHPGVTLVAAADPRSDARERFAREFGARTYPDVTSLCADTDVNVVYVASPHEFHAAQAIEAARAGKHVLVEKPMATSINDCAAMAEAAREAGITMIVGPSHSFDAPVKLARDLIASGDYGDVRMVTAINFTDYCYRPRRPEEFDARRGGGVVCAQAVHQVDVVRHLVRSPVISVRAQAGNWDATRPGEGAYAAFLTFANGAAATLTYSGYGRYDSDELCDWVSETGYRKDPEAYGEARRKLANAAGTPETVLKSGRAYGANGLESLPPPPAFHEHFGFVLVSCDGADIRLTPTGVTVYGADERHSLRLPAPTVPRAAVFDELIDAVAGGGRPLHDAQWGTATMACCFALLESSNDGREIVLNP